MLWVKGSGVQRAICGVQEAVYQTMHSNLLNVRVLHMAACIGAALVLRHWLCGHAAVVFAYVFVWRLALWGDAGHGPQCRWSTCAAFGISCSIIVGARLLPVFSYVCGVACLPAQYLWWPPKGDTSESSWAELEQFVQNNLQTLAQRHRTCDCTGPGVTPAQSLLKAIQERSVVEKKALSIPEAHHGQRWQGEA